MNELEILGALCGLCGAVQTGRKSPDTDRVMRDALLHPDDSTVEAVHHEKFVASPGCATCQNPCGNTSDADLTRLESDPEELRALKRRVIAAMREAAARSDGPLPDAVCKAIACLGYDLDAGNYERILEELKSC